MSESRGSLLYKNPREGLSNRQITAPDGPRFARGPDRARPSSRYGEVHTEPTYEACERDDWNAYPPECVGPHDPEFSLARRAAASGYAERLRAMGLSVTVRTLEDRSQVYRVGANTAPELDEASFAEAAHGMLYSQGSYSGEQVAQLATEYGQWFIANYRLYPYAKTAAHKDEPPPPLFAPGDNAAAFAEGGRKAKAFTDPMVKGMGWTVFVIGGVAAFGPYFVAGSADSVPLASWVIRSLGPKVASEALPSLFKVDAQRGSMSAAEVKAMARGISTPATVNRFFNTQHTTVPRDVREMVKRIVVQGVGSL